MIAKKFILMALVGLLIPLLGLHAQDTVDTTVSKKKKVKPELLIPYHRNTIKFNPTPMLIQAVEVRNITFTYERLITRNQSLSLQAGYLVFPNLFSDTVAGLINIDKGDKWGLNMAFDYRYYPFSRNRRPAPDGLYIGGYLSYYGFKWDNPFDILHTTVDQSGRISGNLNVVNLGFELGYQFIFWKRFSVDLLMFGPSLSLINGELNISGELDPDQIKNLDQEMVEKLLNRFPWIGNIFSDKGLQFTGSKTEFKTLFRYSLQLGFHF